MFVEIILEGFTVTMCEHHINYVWFQSSLCLGFPFCFVFSEIA